MKRFFKYFVVFFAVFAVRAVPARAVILVDHQPLNTGGPSADTDFVDFLGHPYWQLVADDFTLTNPATVAHLKWWGFYGNNFSNDSTQPPPGNETMRVRFYDDQGGSGLPGNVLYEQSILNPNRTPTGRPVFTTRIHPEFVYDADLPIPFEASALSRYWLEIVQVGIPASVFRWEGSSAPSDIHAFINPDVPGWTESTPVHVNLAFQLTDVPEPATVFLFATVPLFARRRRR